MQYNLKIINRENLEINKGERIKANLLQVKEYKFVENIPNIIEFLDRFKVKYQTTS